MKTQKYLTEVRRLANEYHTKEVEVFAEAVAKGAGIESSVFKDELLDLQMQLLAQNLLKYEEDDESGIGRLIAQH